MLLFVFFSALVASSLGIECSKDRSGRPDPEAISIPAGNIRLQRGFTTWQIYYTTPICSNSVLEVKLCDDVQPQLMVLSPWTVSVVRRGDRGPRAVVKGKYWCRPEAVFQKRLEKMKPPLAVALKY